MTFKDPELSTRYKYEARIFVYNRAKVYCIFLILAIMLSPYNLLFGKETFLYYAGMMSATVVPMALTLALASYRLFFIDLLVPLNFITRGMIGIYLHKRH